MIYEIEKVTKLIEDHGIEVMVVDAIFHAKQWFMVDGNPDFEWVDITGWTVEDANKWLGY